MQETVGKATRMFLYLPFFARFKVTDSVLIVERIIWSGCIRGPVTTILLVVKHYEISFIAISLQTVQQCNYNVRPPDVY